MNEWNTFLKNFVLSIIEYADNKIKQKLAVGNQIYEWEFKVRLSSVCLQFDFTEVGLT